MNTVIRSYKVCGLDEAGRGALAGPLVAAAVILNSSARTLARLANVKLKDGKLLNPHQRNQLYQALRRTGATIAIEVISTRRINNHGIGWANREVFRKLVRRTEADEYIIDGRIRIGRVKEKTKRIRSMVDADARIPGAIAAGIVAKVERDRIMRRLHKEFPRYHWKSNAGYATKTHVSAILAYSSTRYHRNVFVTTALRDR